MTDIVYLHGVKCQCTLGVWAWEKVMTQAITLDIDVATDISLAAKSDSLSDALDYQAIAKRVQSYCQASRFELIETLIQRLADVILQEFETSWVRLKLDKGQAVSGVQHVGIIIERGVR